jgi:hypothetical protein
MELPTLHFQNIYFSSNFSSSNVYKKKSEVFINSLDFINIISLHVIFHSYKLDQGQSYIEEMEELVILHFQNIYFNIFNVRETWNQPHLPFKFLN